MLTAIILDMFDPYFRMIIIDKVLKEGRMELFKMTLLGLAGVTIGRAVLGYIKEYFFDLGGSKTVLGLRNDLFKHIQSQSFCFFDRENTGELMSRIKEDGENVLNASVFGIMLFSEQLIYFLIASVMLLRLNMKLALICLAVMPFIAMAAFKLEKLIGICYEKISDQRASMNTTAQENIAGVRLVKAFGREKYEIAKFLEQNKQYFDLNVEQARILSNYNPLIEFLSNITILMVTIAGGLIVIGDGMTIGELVAFNTYIYMLIWPMRMLGWLSNVLAQCRASLKKIDAIFNEAPKITSPENNAGKASAEKSSLEFRKVSFKYNEKPVLENINLTVESGKTLAVMGETGSGKSTLINLIGRFYDCTEGEVLFNGINVKEMDLKDLRGGISMVMQETFLFSDSLKENIVFGDNRISEQAMVEAAKAASAVDFIDELEEGFDSVIGERGTGLSGGQKQRVSIARALARESKILILDDSTSALDTETEKKIQRALLNKEDMIKIIVAHRISAVKNADEIIILSDGKIVERGTHEELLSLKGKYFETYAEQYKGRMLYDECAYEEVV
jgi:ATP-binding cassette subfamily B protein